MSEIVAIHKDKQPKRPHYVPEWAETRSLSQADLVRLTGIDKSTVSRWFSGSTPNLPSQDKLAAVFEVDREALFRHPDDDWLARFFAGRRREEIERIKATLEAAFPRAKSSG